MGYWAWKFSENCTHGRDVNYLCQIVFLPQILMSATRGPRCVEPIRSVETRSGHTLVVTLSRAVPVTSLTTKAAAVKVTFRLLVRVQELDMGWVREK